MAKNNLYRTDEELVSAVISGDQEAIVYFFYEKFSPTFQYHICNIFPYRVDVAELVNEFFLYMYKDGWRRLRTYDGSTRLVTWISVVSYRFFRNYKQTRVDCNGIVCRSGKWDSLTEGWCQENATALKMDMEYAISRIPTERDRRIAERLFIADAEYERVAEEFGLSVDYVYTVKNRLLGRIKKILSD